MGRTWRRRTIGRAAAAALTGTAVAAATTGPASAHGGRRPAWTTAWTCATSTPPTGAVTELHDETIRQVIHPTASGERARIRVSNRHGAAPLHIGGAHLAPAGGRGRGARLSFGGRPQVRIPAGGECWSDPVRQDVEAGADVAVSLYLPRRTEATTVHDWGLHTNTRTPGDTLGGRTATGTPFTQYFFLDAVAVESDHHQPVWVALGDSITDGVGTEVDANLPWPAVLARRLRDSRHGAGRRIGVVNAGLDGNRLLHSANPPAGSPAEAYGSYFGDAGLRRLDHDALSLPGVAGIIVSIGINDLGMPGAFAPAGEEVSAGQLLDGYREVARRAHRRGQRVVGMTLPPFAPLGEDTLGYYSPARERRRQEVNTAVRRGRAGFDAVVDVDAVLRDPADPRRQIAALNHGDGVHPTAPGLARIADAVDLNQLERLTRR